MLQGQRVTALRPNLQESLEESQQLGHSLAGAELIMSRRTGGADGFVAMLAERLQSPVIIASSGPTYAQKQDFPRSEW